MFPCAGFTICDKFAYCRKFSIRHEKCSYPFLFLRVANLTAVPILHSVSSPGPPCFCPNDLSFSFFHFYFLFKFPQALRCFVMAFFYLPPRSDCTVLSPRNGVVSFMVLFKKHFPRNEQNIAR